MFALLYEFCLESILRRVEAHSRVIYIKPVKLFSLDILIFHAISYLTIVVSCYINQITAILIFKDRALMWIQGYIAIMAYDNFKLEFEYLYPSEWRKVCGIKTGSGVRR